MRRCDPDKWVGITAVGLQGSERLTVIEDHRVPSLLFRRVAPQRWLLALLCVLLLIDAGLWGFDKLTESRHAAVLEQTETLESDSLDFSEAYPVLNGGRSGLFQSATALSLLDPSLQAFEQSAVRAL